MANNSVEQVMCPLVDRMISVDDCIENADVARGMIKPDTMPEEYKAKADWRDICTNCKWHNY